MLESLHPYALGEEIGWLRSERHAVLGKKES
jgi:hypothetical protein